MRKAIFFTGLLLSCQVAVTSCKKDPEENPKPGSASFFNPTPFKFSIPAWVEQELGPMPVPADNPTTEEGVLLGRMLFYDKQLSDKGTISCASCHSPTGAGIPAQFPRLAGQHADYTAAQLAAFRDGARNNSVQMTAIAAKLNDREIRAVADYIAGLR